MGRDSASISEINMVQYQSGEWWGWGLRSIFEWNNFSIYMVKHGFIHFLYVSYIMEMVQ